MKKLLAILILLFACNTYGQTVDSVKEEITDLIISPRQPRAITGQILGGLMNASLDAATTAENIVTDNTHQFVSTAQLQQINSLVDSFLATRTYTDEKFLSVTSASLQGVAETTTDPGANVAGRWWWLEVSDEDQTFTDFDGIEVAANEIALAIDDGTDFIKYTLPIDEQLNAAISAQGLITQSAFETVQQPVAGLVKTRFNHGTLSASSTNYGTSLTRLIDSAFTYNGVLTSLSYYSTRAGAITFKSIEKNVDGTYNVIASLIHTAIIGNNTIDSATLVNMRVVAGGTIGWYGSASTGGGVGFTTGSTMATKTLTGNVSGNNLTFGASSNTSIWGIKATYRVSPTLAFDSVVFPYGHTAPPVYNNQITYTGGADTLTNIFSTGTIVTDALVTSTGGTSSSAGWKYVSIPITDKQPRIFVSKINVRPGSVPASGYYRFANTSNTTISFGYYTALKDTSYAIPTGAVTFMIDIQDPTTTSSAYANAVISYRGSKATKIYGIDFAGTGSSAGGNPFNQDLNTYDDGQLNSLRVYGLYLDTLPVGNGVEPAGVDIGDMWQDWDGVSDSSTLKIRKQ